MNSHPCPPPPTPYTIQNVPLPPYKINLKHRNPGSAPIQVSEPFVSELFQAKQSHKSHHFGKSKKSYGTSQRTKKQGKVKHLVVGFRTNPDQAA